MDTFEISNNKILKTTEDDCEITIEENLQAIIEYEDLGISEDVFEQFCMEKNIKEQTISNYETALKSYTRFHHKSIRDLLIEAMIDEHRRIPLKERRLKKRLVNWRTYLLTQTTSWNTIKTYMNKILAFYRHFEVEIPQIKKVELDQPYQTSYLDLPTKQHIRDVVEHGKIDLWFQAVIMFMSSSGSAKAETLSLTVSQFIEGTRDYHNDNGNIRDILNQLSLKKNVVPTLYLRRIKTDKYYYTFCSPEASEYIVRYLLTRDDLKLEDKLFDVSESKLIQEFKKVNDRMGYGFKGRYRFFRSHTLRKYHASNINLAEEYIDSLQGRSKDYVHETYIKTNPKELKQIYMSAMENVMIFIEDKEEKHEEYHIHINIFVSDNKITL